MALNRYTRTSQLASADGLFYATPAYINVIRSGIQNGNIGYKTEITTFRARLDHIAAREYGDGRLWWIIAAASGIGWGLQVPQGTNIKIPDDIEKIIAFVG